MNRLPVLFWLKKLSFQLLKQTGRCSGIMVYHGVFTNRSGKLMVFINSDTVWIKLDFQDPSIYKTCFSEFMDFDS